TPEFEVTETGDYTIHTLVYDARTLDLSIVVPGTTTGFDVNGLLVQGGGDICAALDVAGAPFSVEECAPCSADAGSIWGAQPSCLTGSYPVALSAPRQVVRPKRPFGYRIIYVLTAGDDLVIQDVNSTPYFLVGKTGEYRIHTLVYDPETLDLGIVVPGVTTGFDVNSLLQQGGGSICASLDVEGADFTVKSCGGASADIAGGISATAFPNPTTSVINMAFAKDAFEGEINVTISDLQGAITTNYRFGEATLNTTIDINELPKGVYFAQIRYANARVETLRFVKQ
ncbi:MAG: T9SS type A sorting domain-containing protein, partial [Bacteroidota bacterium]